MVRVRHKRGSWVRVQARRRDSTWVGISSYHSTTAVRSGRPRKPINTHLDTPGILPGKAGLTTLHLTGHNPEARGPLVAGAPRAVEANKLLILAKMRKTGSRARNSTGASCQFHIARSCSRSSRETLSFSGKRGLR